MKFWQHFNVIWRKLECNEEMQYYTGRPHATQTPHFLFGHKTYTFSLPKSNRQEVAVMPPCCRTQVLKRKIFLNDVVF